MKSIYIRNISMSLLLCNISYLFSLAPDQGFGSGLSLAPFAPSGDHYSDEHLKESTQGSALDLDINRPANSGLDDVNRPSLDCKNYI